MTAPMSYFSDTKDFGGFRAISRYILTRSSAIAERPARRSVLVEMLFYCHTNNKQIACRPEEHFRQLPRFILLLA